MPSAVLSAGDTAVNTTDQAPCPQGADSPQGEMLTCGLGKVKCDGPRGSMDMLEPMESEI